MTALSIESNKTTSRELTFYPSYTYKHSPTFNAWCKLTASDIHDTLTDRRGHDGLRHLWFYLNHPVQYVDVTAPVVAIELLGNGGKYALVTLDDGSGAVIGVKVTRLVMSSDGPDAVESDKSAQYQESQEGTKYQGDSKTAETTTVIKAVAYSSSTTVDNVQVHSRLGHFSITIDGRSIDIGTVLRAKGTVGTWWSTRQIDLLRASVCPSTRKEVESWRELARFKATVLSRPWKLSERRVKRAEKEWRDEREADKKTRQRWNEYQRRKKERERKAEAAYEVTRRKQELQMNKGALI